MCTLHPLTVTMSLRKSSSSGDLYSAFVEAEDCFQALERGNESMSVSQLFEEQSSELSLLSMDQSSSSSSSARSLCSNGSAESKADRKSRRRKSKNRADLIRQQLANTQDVKRNIKSFRRSNSNVDIMAQDCDVVRRDAAMVEESLRAMQEVVLQATQATRKRRSTTRSRSTGNLLL